MVTAARYDPESGDLMLAQGYEPLGQVWSDVKLYSRQELIERIASGERVVCGKALALGADFERQEPLTVQGEGTQKRLVSGDRTGKPGDDLGVPQF